MFVNYFWQRKRLNFQFFIFGRRKRFKIQVSVFIFGKGNETELTVIQIPFYQLRNISQLLEFGSHCNQNSAQILEEFVGHLFLLY